MNQLIKKGLLICFLFITTSAWAASTPEDAQTLVRETTDKMLDALTKEKDNIKANPKRVYTLVDQIVLPHFDFARMSKFVLAQNWKAATVEQQNRFIKEFRDLLVRTYAAALIEAAGQKVDVTYLPVRAEDNAERITLKTQVKQANKQPINVDYDMYVLNNVWKVFNISVGGVSLVTNYRTEFENDIKTVGMDGLINKLAKNNREAEAAKKE